jgi:hypothetical protein
MIPTVARFLGHFLDAHTPINVTGYYSEFSGLVGSVPVGYPPQNIKVGLDALSSSNSLWSPIACPAFLEGGCFRRSDSWTQGFNFRDDFDDFVTVGGRLTGPLYFMTNALEEHRVGNFGYGLDVAGFIGIGPDSELFSGKQIEVKDEPDGARVSLLEVSLQDTDFDLRLTRLEAQTWSFQAWIDSKEIGLVYAGGESGILVSANRIETFMTALIGMKRPYAVSPDNTVLVACNRIANKRLSFKTQRNEEIAVIYGESLLAPGSDMKGRICETVIEVDNEGSLTPPMIYIGRLFNQAVDRLVLDYRDGSMRIKTRKRRARPVTREGVMTTPLFTMPSIEGYNIIFRKAREEDTRKLVLESMTPFGRGGPRQRCFSFLRIGWTGDTSQRTIAGSFSHLAVRLFREEVIFILEFHGSDDRVSVFIEETFDRIYVCENAFSGHATTDILESNPDRDSCAICLEELKVGEEISRLSCNHVFHPNCVMEWLTMPQRKRCPVCRAPTKAVVN